jgi:hypothetical protein
MLKHLPILCLLLIFSENIKAQKNTASNQNNPFGGLEFSKGPTDTLTLIASYAGEFGKLSENNVSTLQCISKLYGLNIKKIRYSIFFELDGYPQKFDVPCRDNDLINTLTSQPNIANKLKLKCIVYRFFTIDGIINFFYIDKGILAGKGIIPDHKK